jgi:hypothetical protein
LPALAGSTSMTSSSRVGVIGAALVATLASSKKDRPPRRRSEHAVIASPRC